MTLFDSLSKIAEQIQNQRDLMKTEEATKMVSIRPFIRAMGYDIFNLAEVEPEYTADAHSSGTERVDYVIKREGKPIVLIEAKSADIKLKKNHWKQLHNYFVALDVEFGVLTNGLEYRFFTDLTKRNVMDEEPFLVINMDKLDASSVNALEGFSKARYAPAETVRKIKLSNLLEKELSQPSDDLVKHFAKYVHSGRLSQSIIQEYRPLVKRAWDDLVDQEIARRLRRPQTEDEEEQALPQPEPEVETPTTASLAGTARELPIFANYKGKRFDAIFLLREDVKKVRKNVRYEGEVIAPSQAAKRVIQSVNPHLSGASAGWNFWKFVDPESDQERQIDDLRKDAELVRRLLGGA